MSAHRKTVIICLIFCFHLVAVTRLCACSMFMFVLPFFSVAVVVPFEYVSREKTFSINPPIDETHQKRAFSLAL